MIKQAARRGGFVVLNPCHTRKQVGQDRLLLCFR